MPTPFAALQTWLTAAGGHAAAVTLAAGATSSDRGLATAHAVDPGTPLVRVPLAAAITPSSALRSPALASVLGDGGRDRLRTLMVDDDVPSSSLLLLTLGLAADLAWGDAGPRAPYVALLPAPPGSRVAAACPAGPAATDVTLFSEAHLAALACPPLAAAVATEQARLTRIHARLFGDAAADPPISLPSLLWCSSLVRSRALDLRIDGADAPALERVMLPVIDLAQHGGRARGACVLRLVTERASDGGRGGGATPVAVELVATAPLPAGASVTLDYGDRPMRDLLRGYAFVPSSPPAGVSEIFEDVGRVAPGHALVVDASTGQGLALTSVNVLASPGDDAALETTAARVVWCVGAPRAGGAVRATPDGGEVAMPPADEAAAARRVGRAARALADSIEAWRAEAGSDDGSGWIAAEHARLAAAYRAARVALLRAAADACEAQAASLGGGGVDEDET